MGFSDEQCVATINPPRVMAVSAISHGPDVVVPSAWRTDHGPPSHSAHIPPHPASRPQPGHATAAQRTGNIALSTRSGYTTQHARYNQELERWAKRSFASPPAETISLKIAAHYEGNAKRTCNQSTIFGVSLSYFIFIQGTDGAVQNICEGKKDIDALITADGLVTISLETIIPKVKMFCPSFPWRVDEFVVRDSEWVDLSAHHSPLPYFYSQCLQPARKNSNIYTFKPKQFALFVVVPAAQWAEYEAFINPGTPPPVDSNAGPSTSNERNFACSTGVNQGPASSDQLPARPFVQRYAQSTFMPTRLGITSAQPSQGK